LPEDPDGVTSEEGLLNCYFVADTDERARLVELRDLVGEFHFAYCISELPRVGAELWGDLPSIGFALMLGPQNQVYRLIFSDINCGQRAPPEESDFGALPEFGAHAQGCGKA
jgi:hypothetical protein